MNSKDYLEIPKLVLTKESGTKEVNSVFVNHTKGIACTTTYDLYQGALNRNLKPVKIKPMKDVFIDNIQYIYYVDSFNNVFQIKKHVIHNIYFKMTGTNSKRNRLIHTSPELYQFNGIRKNTKNYKSLQKQCREKAKEYLAVLDLYPKGVIKDIIVTINTNPYETSALVGIVQTLVDALCALDLNSPHLKAYSTNADTYGLLITTLHEENVSKYLMCLELEAKSDCTVRLECADGNVISDIAIEDKE